MIIAKILLATAPHNTGFIFASSTLISKNIIALAIKSLKKYRPYDLFILLQIYQIILLGSSFYIPFNFGFNITFFIIKLKKFYYDIINGKEGAATSLLNPFVFAFISSEFYAII